MIVFDGKYLGDIIREYNVFDNKVFVEILFLNTGHKTEPKPLKLTFQKVGDDWKIGGATKRLVNELAYFCDFDLVVKFYLNNNGVKLKENKKDVLVLRKYLGWHDFAINKTVLNAIASDIVETQVSQSKNVVTRVESTPTIKRDIVDFITC